MSDWDDEVHPHLLSQLSVGSDVVLQSSLSFSQHSQLLAEALHQLFLHHRGGENGINRQHVRQLHIIIVALTLAGETPKSFQQQDGGCVLPCTSARRRRPSPCDRWSPSSVTAAELWPPTCCNRTNSWSSHRIAWRREEEGEKERGREGVYFI